MAPCKASHWWVGSRPWKDHQRTHRTLGTQNQSCRRVIGVTQQDGARFEERHALARQQADLIEEWLNLKAVDLCNTISDPSWWCWYHPNQVHKVTHHRKRAGRGCIWFGHFGYPQRKEVCSEGHRESKDHQPAARRRERLQQHARSRDRHVKVCFWHRVLH